MGVEWRENQQAIGSFGIVHMEEEINSVKIGYCIGEEKKVRNRLAACIYDM